MKREKVDVLVIGAGPSGTVSASYLNNHGIQVKIVEKAKFPRYSVGESLIPRCMDNFEAAGLLDCLKKQGYQKKTGARFIKDDQVGEFDFSKKFTDGWDWTWQVPRDDFDNVLAQECIKNGVAIDFETEVTQVKFDGSKSTTTLRNKNGEETEIEADYIIDSSGFGRVIARQLGLEAAPKVAQHSSIFTQVKDVNRPPGKDGTFITFEVLDTEVWLWYIPFSNGNTSLGFVGPNAWFEQFNGSNSEQFQHLLQYSKQYKKQFENLPFLFEPYKVQNIAKNVTKLYGEGFVLTGNSAEFLDPIFSSGVSFATESAILAAKLVIKELKNEPVNWEKDFEDYLKQGVDVFSTYVNEWYSGNLQKIIFHPKNNEEVKSQICAVLAGYVWDQENPFVKKHHRLVKNVAHLVEMERNQ